MNGKKPILAMIALDDGALPPLEPVLQCLRQALPDAPAATAIESRADLCSFRIGDEQGAYALMPTPIPWRELEQPCAEAWYWPQAAETMRRHRRHVVVTLAGGRSDMATRCLLLTQVTAALAANSHCTGIYWGAGALVNSAPDFIAQSRDMSREYLPLSLWIGFRTRQRDDDTIDMYTVGMKVFGHHEIEVQGSRAEPKRILNTVFSAAHYLIDNGPVFSDGDSFGLTEDDEVAIHIVRSARNPSQQVYQFSF